MTLPRIATWILAAVACAAVAGAGLLEAPGHLLATPGGEVWGHAWVQWWHGRALPAWPAGTDLALGTAQWPVIDPLVTLGFAALGRVVGVVAAWNLGLLAAVAGAFLGGAWLARREGGEPIVGGLALALAPCFLGTLASGLTEDAALGLAAVGLGLVGSTRWRHGLLAGLCLGLLASCGLVLAWQAALAAVALGLWRAVGERASIGPTLLGGAVAAALAAPAAWLQGARLAGEGHRSGQLATGVEPLWRLNPWRGVDLASLVSPWPQEAGEALVRLHPGYLGLGLLALAVLGGRGAGRWWLVLAGAVLAALGETLSLAGRPLGLGNPVAALVDLVPGGALVNHHGRLLLVGAVALSVLAARGAGAIRRRWGRRGVVVAVVLVALDLVLLAPGGAPLPTADPTPPRVVGLLDQLSPGRVLVVPVAGPGVHFQRPLLDQRIHGRPLLLDPKHPGLPPAVAATEAGRWLGGLALPRPPAAPAAGQARDQLSSVEVLVVMEPYVAVVAEVLGPPDLAAPDSAAWDLASR